MNFLFFFIDFIFRLSVKVQKKVAGYPRQKAPKSSIITRSRLLIFSAFLCFLAAIFFSLSFLLYMALLLIFIKYVLDLKTRALYMLTTVRGFFQNAISFSFLLFLLLSSLLLMLEKNLQSLFGKQNAEVILFLLTSVLACSIWAFISCCANTKVSILVNATLTAIFRILSPAINHIVSHLPSNFIISSSSPDEEVKSAEAIQFLKSEVNNLLFPVMIILAIAALFCILKKYWIEKYNHGQDIEALPEDSMDF